MRAVVQEDVGRLVCREVPEPEPRRDEVKIKVACCGVCGSDIHAYQGVIPMETKPFIPGHEFTGTVCAVGSEVTRFQVGDRVTAQPFRTADSLCIVGVHCDGAMAEYVCMEEKYTFRLPDSISFEDGTLIEPACVSGHAVLDYADLRPADDVAVIGAGAIGMMAALVARAGGARVFLIGRTTSAGRLALGKALGIPEILMSDRDDVRQTILERTNGRGVRVCFETGGSEQSIAQAVSLVARGGKLIELALTAPGGVHLGSFGDIVQKEITVQGSNCSLWENWPRIIDMLDRGQLRFDGLITRKYSLEACEAAFRTRGMKNLICP